MKNLVLASILFVSAQTIQAQDLCARYTCSASAMVPDQYGYFTVNGHGYGNSVQAAKLEAIRSCRLSATPVSNGQECQIESCSKFHGAAFSFFDSCRDAWAGAR